MTICQAVYFLIKDQYIVIEFISFKNEIFEQKGRNLHILLAWTMMTLIGLKSPLVQQYLGASLFKA